MSDNGFSDREIKAYDSMSEFYAAMGGQLEQDVDFTIHRLEDVHGDVPVKSPLFRANYYSILIIKQGRGRYFIDAQTYPTRARTLYFTNPGHIKGFEIDALTYGYVVTFSESFLRQYVYENVFDNFPFLIAEIAPPSYPEPDVFQIFASLGEQLLQEYQSGSAAYKFQVIGSLTVVLLYKLKEHFWEAYNPLEEAQANSEIAQTFKRDLERHFSDLIAGRCDRLFQVQDYAQAQHLNPSYFSTVVKCKTGKPVGAWITERTLTEARALLARSSDSVREVATRLGFKEAAHFSRFFKKHTGLSPTQFRKQLQQI